MHVIPRWKQLSKCRLVYSQASRSKYSSQCYTKTDWKVVNIWSYTFVNVYIMAHLLCAKEYWFIDLIFIDFYSSQCYTKTDWKVVNIWSYTFVNMYIMAHLLCAEEYWFIWVKVMECRSAPKSNDEQNCFQMCWTLNWKLTTFLLPPLSSVGVRIKTLIKSVLTAF